MPKVGKARDAALERHRLRFEDSYGLRGKALVSAYWRVNPLKRRTTSEYLNYAENFIQELLSEMCVPGFEKIDFAILTAELVRRSFTSRQIAIGAVSTEHLAKITGLILEQKSLILSE